MKNVLAVRLLAYWVPSLTIAIVVLYLSKWQVNWTSLGSFLGNVFSILAGFTATIMTLLTIPGDESNSSQYYETKMKNYFFKNSRLSVIFYIYLISVVLLYFCSSVHAPLWLVSYVWVLYLLKLIIVSFIILGLLITFELPIQISYLQKEKFQEKIKTLRKREP